MHFFGKRGQQSVEFLIVMGIAFTMLIPTLFIFSQYTSSSNQIVAANQINRIGREMIAQSESIYFFGENSRTTLRVTFPDRINSIHINPKNPPESNLTEIVFNVSLFGGNSDLVYFSNVNITANFTADYSMKDAVSEGLKTFRIESFGDYVHIQRNIN
ncbi:MAG: hypothetical protein ACLFPQ_06655 [Candidatus Woesearchaeota archaeon]